MLANPSFIISVLALLVSAATLYLTYLKRGTVKMTQPTTIFFGNDGNERAPKIYLRSLLYSTARRGQIVESLYIKIRRAETVQNFNVWVYGARKELVRGSGLFVGQEGVTANHHFLLPKDGTTYTFTAGEYIMEIYCTLVNRRKSLLLHKTHLLLSDAQAIALQDVTAGVYFDWGPDAGKYHSFIDRRELTIEELADKLL